MDCVFCKIVAGELPSEGLGRNGGAIAIKDLDPKAPTHALVIPVEHITDASELTEQHGPVLGSVFALAAQVARDQKLDSGYRLVYNVGDDAGNTVPHLHLHLIGGRPLTWPPG